MTTVRVFDPAMCCSTGICGPSLDARLVRFAADLDWLKSQGVSVERFNLAQQPAAFADDAAVKGALEAQGEASLPLVKVNGEVKSSGSYPTRDELAAWAGLAAPALDAGGERGSKRKCCGSAGKETSAAKEGGCCRPTNSEANERDASGCCKPGADGESPATKHSGCC